MRRVAILGYDGLALFELGCAVELFALPRPEFNDWYHTQVICFEQKPLEVTGGISLNVKQVTDLSAYDVLIIPSWPTEQSNNERIIGALQDMAKNSKRIISFCSGAFLLAEAGLLENRQATTHWRYAEKFRRRFPSVHYVEDVLYLYDGQIGCSAGSSAAIDLGLAVIRDDFGHAIANQVARRLVLAAHRSGGQSQFVETPLLKTPSLFSSALDWACKNLDQNICINQLADKAGMSRRTFDRKFSSSFNTGAKIWLTQQRIQRVKHLLEESQDTVEQIATKSGFDNAITLRHHFRKHVGISPSQYRQQFSGSKQP